MSPTPARTPALIGLDWGTSSLRAFLFDAHGSVLARVQNAQGVMAVVDGRFRETFEALCAPWLAAHAHLPVIASGMVGSRQGWREAPYQGCPVGFEDLATRLGVLDDLAGRPMRLVPGVRARGALGSPDVMRGEETQVFGALIARDLLGRADRAHRDGVFVLPGTHSKWVEVRGDRIVALRTYLTGETYAVLRQHSILGRLCEDAPDHDDAAQAAAQAAFDAGVTQGAAHRGALLHLLFTVRTEGLFGRYSATQLPAYLSGLLLGAEIADARDWAGEADTPTLVGTHELASRYARALSVLGMPATLAPEACTAEGLFALAAAGGLVPCAQPRGDLR